MSSLRMSLENQVQNLLNDHITNFVEIISKEYKIPKEELWKKWNGESNKVETVSNRIQPVIKETEYGKMKAIDLLALCRTRKLKFTSVKKCDTIRALEEDDRKKKNNNNLEVEKDGDLESDNDKELSTNEKINEVENNLDSEEKKEEEKDEEEDEKDEEEEEEEEKKEEEEEEEEEENDEEKEEEKEKEEEEENDSEENEKDDDILDIPIIEYNEEIEENFEFTDNYDKMKVTDLLQLCKEKKIKAKSNHKANLILALRGEISNDISKKTLKELKEECIKKGIPFRESVTKKNELIELLNNFQPEEQDEIETFKKNVESMIEKEKEEKKLIDCSIEELRERCKEYGIVPKKMRHEELLDLLEIKENEKKYNRYQIDTEGIL